MLIIVGMIDWMVGGDRRRVFGVLMPVGAIIALLPWLCRADDA